MQDTNKNRVAIYIRVSTLHQIDKDSLPMQRKDLIAYSNLILNTNDFVIFEDAGYSGKNTDRPKYQEMMSLIRTGAFTHLLVWKIDRISRNLIDFSEMYNELKQHRVTFVSKSEQFDTSTAVGEAMLKIILVFAELERQMTAERVTATMISRAANGLWNGGRVPLGYDYEKSTKIFSENEQSHIIRRIFDEYEQCQSIETVCHGLNADGVKTKRGNDWTFTTVRNVLRNVFYAGDYLYNVCSEGNHSLKKDKSEWILYENHHPAIIERDQFNKVQQMLDGNIRLRRDGSRHKKLIHVFAEKLQCYYCGRILSPTNASKSRWTHSNYRCLKHTYDKSACPNPTTSDAVIGEYFLNFVLNVLNARKDIRKIKSPADIEDYLISGSCFSYVAGIKEQSLLDLYHAIKSTRKNESVFEVDFSKKPINKNKSVLSNLKAQRTKLQQAIDKLTNLYLYSSSSMTEQEYISKREELELKISSVNEKLVTITASELVTDLPNDDYHRMASQYIITESLKDRDYVNYKRLAMETEPEVLQQFVDSIIDTIVIKDSMATKIIFRNGLCVDFILRDDAKRFQLSRNRKKP